MDDKMEDTADNSRHWSSSGCSSDENETFEDEFLPRIGDDYQVEIPELVMRSDDLQDIVKAYDSSNSWSVGLPVSVMWVYGDGETIESEVMKAHGNRDCSVIYGSAATESSQESQITSNDEDAEHKIEPLGTISNYSKEARQRISKFQLETGSGTTDTNFCLPLIKENGFDNGKKGGRFLPGLTTNTLKDIEYDSFLLGLYIFGKNLHLVKQFVGNRKMGDILSNYYGKFYRTAEYLRWSQSRKVKARRCVQGQRIFTGWRLNELLSRILFHVTEERKKLLIEVSNRFKEGKVSLEDYVFTLKDMVGVNVVVEAVAIGKGKRDLTGTTVDPSKTSQILHTRPDIPSGKACSLLTKGEIIKFLTGDFRLSKAKAGDLFWEAVWPRLLARGWHSEQPGDDIYTSSNNALVFLVPGVKKFSRRKLTKGSHYFDSVNDVLNKVAAEPVHLDLESETENIVDSKEECGLDPDKVPKQQRRYLKPVNSKCSQDPMKFTIVDTSLLGAGKGSTVVQLRDLPVDTMNSLIQSCVSSVTERDNATENQNDTEADYALKIIDNIQDIKECVISNGTNHVQSSPDTRNVPVKNHEGQNTSIPSGMLSNKMVKFQFSRKRKSQNSSNGDSAKGLTACKQDASICGPKAIAEITKLNVVESRPVSSSSDRCEVKKFLSGSLQNISSSSMPCNPEVNSKEVASNTLMDIDMSREDQSQTLKDQNIPYVPMHTNNNLSTIKPCHTSVTSDQPELNLSDNGTGTEKEPEISGRRQSTRIRPLTTKALEAFAFEFSNPKKKRKGVDNMSKRRS